MVILKTKKWIIFGIILILLAVPILTDFVTTGGANAISYICSLDPTCKEAAEREEVANENARVASSSAGLYQAKVDELNAEIAEREKEIIVLKTQVDDLRKEIKETEEKLKARQEALAEVLTKMHFENDAEPITILAGAESISDLAEKQAREEVAKQQISETAEKIKEMKKELEEKKEEIEEKLEQQKSAKAEQEAKRSEQQRLVEKYQNDTEAYNKIAKEERQKQQAAIAAYQEAHKESFSGGVYNGYNTYPWQADCPQRQDDYGTYINGRYIGGYVCECVSYVGWKAYENYGLYLAWGNAYNWDDRARAAGYVVNNSPATGTIGQIDDGAYGHVFWVESVNADGSINVTEYNNAYATRLYSGISRYGDFGARTISASEARRYNYIHF